MLLARRLLATAPRGGRFAAGSRPGAGGRALLVLPYISIVNEKTEHLGRMLAPARWSVKGYSGEPCRGGGWSVGITDYEVLDLINLG